MQDGFINAVKNQDYAYLHACVLAGQTPNVVGHDGKDTPLCGNEASCEMNRMG